MTKKQELKGIDGWLIIPTLNLLAMAGLWAFNFIVWGIVLFAGKTEENALVIFLISGVMAFFSIYSIVLEFRYKKLFPRFAIITLWINVVANWILLFLIEDISGGSSVFFAIIWTCYFNSSKRVKNTFVK